MNLLIVVVLCPFENCNLQWGCYYDPRKQSLLMIFSAFFTCYVFFQTFQSTEEANKQTPIYHHVTVLASSGLSDFYS